MAMRRTTLILLVVLGIVVIGGVALLMLFPEQVKDVIGGKTNTANTNTTVTNTNTSVTPTNLSTPQDLTGDTALTATLTVGATVVQFTSFDRIASFDQAVAPEGQQHVVLYFEGIDAAATSAVFQTFVQAQLVDGDKRYSPNKLKVATNIVKNDRGYVAFLAPTNAKKLVMEVGTGADVQRVELP